MIQYGIEWSDGKTWAYNSEKKRDEVWDSGSNIAYTGIKANQPKPVRKVQREIGDWQ